ncbi:MAG: biotin transporter BioY, partial [Actinomycetota bacterium]|nr:biotin transporter BioY [Actinomycetota bacterium]MDQ4114853.1 biotin transporter BioY [Actinomycetota bacterium]
AGPARTRAVVVFLCSIAGSILIVHPLGIAGMMIYSGEPLSTVWKWDLPFWFGDLVKTGLVAIVAAEVHRAFPNLLRR